MRRGRRPPSPHSPGWPSRSAPSSASRSPPVSPPLYPAGLGFAAGAMIWVVSHEIIPETHRKGHEQAATLGLIGGFVVMMMLDTALG